MTRTPLLALLAAALALPVAGCGGDSSTSSSSKPSSSKPGGSTASAASCTKANLPLNTAGTLTVGTDKPAYPPYYENNDPANGKGFESAVAYAVAKQLGFTKAEVKWTTVPFNSSYAPGPKNFDFDINQISITPQRAKVVDFSTPYFTAPQAVVALKSSGAAGAKSLADLAKAKIGVQVGTTSLDAVTSRIRPSSQPQVFNDSNDTVRALKTERVDAIVTDLPSAFYITAAQVSKGTIVGQFKAPGGDNWGLLLQKNSRLTPCVDRAVQNLRTKGVLDRLQKQYMGGDAAPELN